MKKHAFLMILSIFFVFLSANNAKAGIIDFFFPYLKAPTYDPYQTLEAPFADNPSKPEEVNIAQRLKQRPEEAVPLDQPHIALSNVANWVVTAASNAMSFDAPDYRQDLVENLVYFEKNGHEEFQKFLRETGIGETLTSNKFYLRSFVEHTPLLLNQGESGGSYHWLFEVPMMITYMDRRMKDYKGVRPLNQRLTLKVQVGRVADKNAPETLQIEHWSGNIKKADDKS